MNLLFICNSFLPEVGGAERQLRLLSDSLVARGHRVTILTSRLPSGVSEPRWPLFTVKRVFPRRCPERLRSPVLILLTAACLLRYGRRLHAVHCMFVSVHGVAVAMLRRFLGYRWLIRLACTGRFGELAGLPGGWRGRVLGFALNRADCALALSRESAGELEGFGIDPALIEILPNAVDTERFTPRGRDYAAASRILFVGRLTAQKNPEALLRAVAALRRRIPGIRLTMAGIGELRDDLREAAVQLGLEGALDMPGMVNEPLQLYRDHDVFVLPSLAEGMSNALLEAMACGMPVVATSASGSADLVRDGVNGVLASGVGSRELAAALERVIEASPAVRTGMGTAARAAVEERCGVQRVVSRLERIYSGGTAAGAPGSTPQG